jgi:hypothetical protein
MRSRTLLTLLLILAGFCLLPAGAGASSNQWAIFQDDSALLQAGDASRERLLDELDALGVDVIKAQLLWADAAPRGKRKPEGFDGSDPSQYPGWGRYDALVRDAQARGLRVMLAVSPPYPGWATKRRGDLEGAVRPSAREFGRFAEAAGEHYPSVDLWTIGNEPNHPGFLYPQSKRGGAPVAPHLYRSMVRSSVAALHRSGHEGHTILFGELLPIGKSATGPKQNLQPIRFLREFFCLDSNWRRFTGRAAQVRGCDRYRKLTGVDGFAYHPYTRPGGPGIVEPSPNDATIRSLGRVSRALDIARRKRRIGGPRMPIWSTEFGFQSRPPDPYLGAKLSRIPGFLGESELWISLRNRRVASFSQFTMTDTPLRGSGDVFGTWQGGLRFADGRPKPGVYSAFRLPIFVRQLGPSAVEVRGAARPGGAGSVVQVQQREGRRGRFADLGGPITVTNARGYFAARFRIAQASRRSFRFRYQDMSSPDTKAVFR